MARPTSDLEPDPQFVTGALHLRPGLASGLADDSIFACAVYQEHCRVVEIEAFAHQVHGLAQQVIHDERTGDFARNFRHRFQLQGAAAGFFQQANVVDGAGHLRRKRNQKPQVILREALFVDQILHHQRADGLVADDQRAAQPRFRRRTHELRPQRARPAFGIFHQHQRLARADEIETSPLPSGNGSMVCLMP